MSPLVCGVNPSSSVNACISGMVYHGSRLGCLGVGQVILGRGERGKVGRVKERQVGVVSIATISLVAGRLSQDGLRHELVDVLAGGRESAPKPLLHHVDR